MNRREFLKASMGLLANLVLLKQTKGGGVDDEVN
jgi:hypothetical protein